MFSCKTKNAHTQQKAADAAQASAKARVDAIVADVKAAPGALQKEATKAGEAAIGEVRRKTNEKT